jgi:predicted nucleotidyltransferase
MRNTSKVLLSKITDEIVIEILTIVIPILEQLRVDYFVIGAFAKDVELLAKGHSKPPSRKTKDIDLAVLMGSNEAYESLKNSIKTLPNFVASEEEPYRFLFKEAYEIDFLPFGAIVNEKGQVELKAKTTFILDMPGFEQIEPWVQTIETEEGLTLRVSSLPGIILLKLFAWEDQPGRVKDIADVDYIVRNFYLLHYEEILETAADLFDLIAMEEILFDEIISARYIGRKIGIMLENAPHLKGRLFKLLERQSNSFSMARLMSYENVEDGQRVIQAMYQGLKEQVGS